MRVNITILLAASALMLSTAAMAQDAAATAPAAAPTPPPVHNKDDDVYCHTTTTLGSYIETKICHTQREWKQISEQSRAAKNRMDTSGIGLGATGRN